jgi:hypothetical protein
MHHEQSNHDLGQAATSMYRNTEPTKRYHEVNLDTLSTSPPPTPTNVSAIRTLPHLPPTVMLTSQLYRTRSILRQARKTPNPLTQGNPTQLRVSPKECI